MPSYSNIVSAPLAAANVSGATTVVSSIDNLPLTGNTIGDIIYVSSAGRLFIWSNGWYNIALVNSSPTITTNLDPFIAFEQDGTPLVLTLEANDPEGIPLIWNYSITSGSLGNTATITQVNNEFTITPSTDPTNAGEFEITFTASDGVAISTLPSTFRLSFYTNWNHGYIPIGTVENTTLPTSSLFGQGISTDGIHFIIGASGAATSSGRAFVVDAATATILRELVDPAPATYNYFGYTTAISGDYCAVGSYGTNDGTNDYSGKVYIYEVDTGNLIRTIDNPNVYGTEANDYFGRTVGMQGNILAVGAYGEDAAGGIQSGVVYVFDITDGTLLYTLQNPNLASTQTNDSFGGGSIAISGNYLVAAATGEDANGLSSSGAVYVFNLTTGQLLYTLSAPFGYQAASIIFGRAFDIDSNTDRMVISSSGSFPRVHVYELSTGTYMRSHDRPSVISTSDIGDSVSLDGHVIVMTSSNNTNENAVWLAHTERDSDTTSYDGIVSLLGTWVSDTGSGPGVYPFTTGLNVQNVVMRNGILGLAQTGHNGSRGIVHIHRNVGMLPNTIIQNANAYNTPNNDQFGCSLAVSGNYAIIGADEEDDAGGTSSGKAYIYDIPSKTLLHTLHNPNAYNTGASDTFGYSVAISGNYAIVGAYLEDDAGGTSSGKAYIFDVTTGALVHTLHNPNAYATSALDYFGYSVAISGNYAIVGAYGEDDAAVDGTSSGKAYIFNVTTGALVHTLHNPNAYATSALDYFGYSVAISGNYAIVGAYGEDDGGSSSGKVYVFDTQSGELLYTLDNLSPNGTTAGDLFGLSVALSGKYLAIGSREDTSGGQQNAGAVMVYDVRDGTLLHTFLDPDAGVSPSYTDDFFGSISLGGTPISIDGHFLGVTAYGEDRSSTYSFYGSAYIFNLITGELVAKIHNPSLSTTATGDTSTGMSIGISGKYALVGYPNNSTTGGIVRVFEANP